MGRSCSGNEHIAQLAVKGSLIASVGQVLWSVHTWKHLGQHAARLVMANFAQRPANNQQQPTTNASTLSL